jgi:hypothetical protein
VIDLLKREISARGQRVAGADSPAINETIGAAPPLSKQRPLGSFGIFELCIQRARNLIRLHEAAHGKKGKPEKYASDAHRAAIVLAVSALDAFVRDFVITRTRALLASKAVALPPALSAEIKKFLKDDALLDAARKDDLLERVEKAFRADFERRSFQGTRNIEDQLRIVGYDDVFHDLAVRAHVNEDTLRADLDRFTERRHSIAHRGDYDLTENPPVENAVTKKEAEDCIKLMCLVAKYIDQMGAPS